MNPAKEKFLKLIDNYKNKLIDPVEMLDWTWLRVFLFNIPDEDFNKYMKTTIEICGK